MQYVIKSWTLQAQIADQRRNKKLRFWLSGPINQRSVFDSLSMQLDRLKENSLHILNYGSIDQKS